MTFTEAVETLLDLDRRGALSLNWACQTAEWDKLGEAMLALKHGTELEQRLTKIEADLALAHESIRLVINPPKGVLP